MQDEARFFTFLVFDRFLFLSASPAMVGAGSPRRLDDKGCHEVTEDWEYSGGRTLKAGTEHCHRSLGAMPLDGKEMLQDHADPGKSLKEIKTQARREACLKSSLAVLREVERVMTRAREGDLILVREFVAVGKRAGEITKECG